jgi:hypothetical protein
MADARACAKCYGFGYTKGGPSGPWGKLDCQLCGGTGRAHDPTPPPAGPDLDALGAARMTADQRERIDAMIDSPDVAWHIDPASRAALAAVRAEVRRLRLAVKAHHGQKADDRCVEDDERLYAAAGLPPCDRRVGDKAAMLANCARFIERRCEGGGWPSYAELEAELCRLRADRDRLADALRPFAEYADALRPDVRDDWAVARRQSVGPNPEVTVRDCRRAAAALKESPP